MAGCRQAQKSSYFLVQELLVRGVAGCTGGVSPERRDGRQSDAGNECCLIACVPDGEIQVCFRGHVQQRNLDRPQGELYVSTEGCTWGRPNIVPLPRAHLQDKVVGISTRDEVGAEIVQYLLERGAGRRRLAPQLPPPPLLREQPRCPHCRERLQALGRRSLVVTVLERGIGRQRGDLPFQSHYTVRIVLCRTRGGYDAIGEVRIAYRPLESLFRAHRETDDS